MTEAIVSTNSVVLRDGSLIFSPKPLCAWAFFLFLEKSQTPGESGSPRAIGSRLAQAWLFSEAYTLNSEPLTEIQLNILTLTMREANRLLNPLTNISVTIDILDDADTLTDSTHVKIKDHEYTILPIPWEAADRWLADVRVSVAQAYKNMTKGYIRRDGDRITDDMLNNPEILGIEEGKLFFEWVKYAVT